MTNCGYFTVDLKQPVPHPPSAKPLDLDSWMKGTLNFLRKRGPRTTGQQSSRSSLWPRSGFTQRSCSPSSGCIWMRWFLKLWLSHHFTLSGSLPRLLNVQFDNVLKSTGISFTGACSPATFIPSTRLSVDMLGHSSAWTAILPSYELVAYPSKKAYQWVVKSTVFPILHQTKTIQLTGAI